ncbi:hypothetical protein Scep_026392 [Stephania cephalantha]|uniref:Uncharacterized protein n=1 Tax=Stephania cephalantha TaxID=152367 RepID=A0AAP0EQN0_9MAGN
MKAPFFVILPSKLHFDVNDFIAPSYKLSPISQPIFKQILGHPTTLVSHL